MSGRICIWNCALFAVICSISFVLSFPFALKLFFIIMAVFLLVFFFFLFHSWFSGTCQWNLDGKHTCQSHWPMKWENSQPPHALPSLVHKTSIFTFISWLLLVPLPATYSLWFWEFMAWCVSWKAIRRWKGMTFWEMFLITYFGSRKNPATPCSPHLSAPTPHHILSFYSSKYFHTF